MKNSSLFLHQKVSRWNHWKNKEPIKIVSMWLRTFKVQVTMFRNLFHQLLVCRRRIRLPKTSLIVQKNRSSFSSNSFFFYMLIGVCRKTGKLSSVTSSTVQQWRMLLLTWKLVKLAKLVKYLIVHPPLRLSVIGKIVQQIVLFVFHSRLRKIFFRFPAHCNLKCTKHKNI